MGNFVREPSCAVSFKATCFSKVGALLHTLVPRPSIKNSRLPWESAFHDETIFVKGEESSRVEDENSSNRRTSSRPNWFVLRTRSFPSLSVYLHYKEIFVCIMQPTRRRYNKIYDAFACQFAFETWRFTGVLRKEIFCWKLYASRKSYYGT